MYEDYLLEPVTTECKRAWLKLDKPCSVDEIDRLYQERMKARGQARHTRNIPKLKPNHKHKQKASHGL